MTHFGKIKSYNTRNGTGMIMPEKGGNALPFARADLPREAPEPTIDQRFGYETRLFDGGVPQAVNLQQQAPACVSPQ
jgi:CspA family cold shock protein